MSQSSLQRFRLDGRVAIVTGALGKLGPVWIEGLLDAGAAVAGVDLPGLSACPAIDELQERHGPRRLRLYQANVTDRVGLSEVRDRVLGDLGAPAVLVNNAGIDQPPGTAGGGYLLEEIPLEVNRQVFEVNTLGMFLASQIFGTEMVKAGRGSVVNIGSLYASVSPDARLYDHLPLDPPFLKPPAYGASKAAVVSLTKYLATAWGPYGVRVNALSPGGVLGGQDDLFKQKFSARVPLGRLAVAEDLTGPLQFLASDASSYVTGAEICVDGGFTAW